MKPVHTSTRKLIWVLLIVAGLGGSAIAVSKSSLSAKSDRKAAQPSSVAAPAPVRQNQAETVLAVTVTAYGLVPDEVTVPVGKVSFLIRNRSGMGKLSFALKRPDQSTYVAGLLGDAGSANLTSVALSAGTYQLAEERNSRLVCKVIVK